MHKIVFLTLAAILGLNTASFARTASVEELRIFSAQTYKIDYSKVDNTIKQKIADEYTQRMKLAAALKQKLSMDSEYNYVSDGLILDFWTKRIATGINPSEEVLKKVFSDAKDLKVAAKYKMRHLVLKNEGLANDLYENLVKESKGAKRIKLFEEYVAKYTSDVAMKNSNGSIGWIDSGNLTPKIALLLKEHGQEEVVKVVRGQDVFEILLIEDISPEHPASFDEAKQFLANTIKKKSIEEEIKKIINETNVKPAVLPVKKAVAPSILVKPKIAN